MTKDEQKMIQKWVAEKLSEWQMAGGDLSEWICNFVFRDNNLIFDTNSKQTQELKTWLANRKYINNEQSNKLEEKKVAQAKSLADENLLIDNLLPKL